MIKTFLGAETAMKRFVEQVLAKDELVAELKELSTIEKRWVTLDSVVRNMLPIRDFDAEDWESFFSKHYFFYELSKRTMLDLGFCPYFIPDYQSSIRFFFAGIELDTFAHRCSHKVWNNEKTYCHGTEMARCPIYDPKKTDYEKIMVKKQMLVRLNRFKNSRSQMRLF